MNPSRRTMLTCFVLLTALSSSASAQKLMSNFPHTYQPDNISCGVTAGKILLNAYRINAGIGPLKTKAGTRWLTYRDFKVGMTHPAKLRDAINAYGLEVGWYGNSSIGNLKSYINQGRPPIVLLRSGVNLWHFTVVIGYDDRNQIFYLSDPASGLKRKISYVNLDRAWTYSHDMSGRYIPDATCPNCRKSGKVWTKCPTCGGTGWWKAGPLKTHCGTCSGRGKWSANCPVCSGRGTVGDFYRRAVELSGAKGHTVIVPKKSTPYATWINGTRYARTCIKNPLSRNVKFRYKWGNGDWKLLTVRAGATRSIWWRYNWVGENRSPDLIVRFDCDFSDNDEYKQYKLKSYAVKTTSCSNTTYEAFKETGNNKIDLYHYD